MIDIKKALKVAVAKKDTTIPELAKRMGLTKQAVYKSFSDGSPRLSTIERAASELGMSAVEFISLGESDA